MAVGRPLAAFMLLTLCAFALLESNAAVSAQSTSQREVQASEVLGRFRKLPPTSHPLESVHKIPQLNNVAVAALRKRFQREASNDDLDNVVSRFDKVNGGWRRGGEKFTPQRLATGAGTAATSYACTGLCCSSKAKRLPAGSKAMQSRWLTNALYHGAKVQIWTWTDSSFWGPANNKTAKWTGQVAGYSGQPQRWSGYTITVLRLSSRTIRLRVPGGGYVEATKSGLIRVIAAPTAGTVFTFTRVGQGHIRFRTIYMTYIAWGQDEKLYHWSKTAGTWETHLMYEVKNVPSFRGVNLGGWLFPERWMTPNLWKDVPTLIDGYRFKLQSVASKKWVSDANGWLSCVGANANSATTFVLRRQGTPTGKVQMRRWEAGETLFAVNGGGRGISMGYTLTPGRFHAFTLRVNPANKEQVMLQASNGNYLSSWRGSLRFSVNSSRVDLRSPAAWRGSTAFTMAKVGEISTAYQLCKGLGPKRCTLRLKRHWDTWIKESDWAWIKKQGLNAVRLPIGYWLTQGNRPDFPYPSGGYVYLDRAFKMAVKYNIRIFLSMHTAPNSNNNLETRDGFYEFGATNGSVTKMLTAVQWVAKRYGSNPMFAGINLLNEPWNALPFDSLVNYYRAAVARVRRYNKCVYVSFNYRFGTFAGELQYYPSWPGEVSNVIQDQHQYKVFTDEYKGLSASAVVDVVRTRDAAWLQSIERGNKFLAMVGEFSNALPINPTSLMAYKPYATTQMQVYSKYAQAGWFFWSYKTEDLFGGWGFRYGVENRYIVKTNGRWGG